MRPPVRILVASALAALGVLAAAVVAHGGSAQAVSITGSWTCSGTTCTATMTNGGGSSIKVFYLESDVALGDLTITSSQADGDRCGAFGPSGEQECFLKSGHYWDAGTQITVTFSVPAGRGARGGAGLKPPSRIRAHGSTSGNLPYDQQGDLTPPATPPPTTTTKPTTTTPPPPPPPCTCKNVKASTYGWGDIQDSGGGPTDFAFRLKWSMFCGGATGKCKGEVDIIPPAGLKLTTPKTLKITCDGKCSQGEAVTLNVNKGPIPVRGTSAAALDKDARGGKSFTFQFQGYCIRDGKRLRSQHTTMTVTYRPNGLVDTRASDLNGDGKPDKK